jgi:adenosine deaminase
MDLRTLPKVELHSHLDCALSFDAVHAIDHRISRDRYEEDFVAPRQTESLAEYLAYTFQYREILQSEGALRIAVQDAFAQMQAENVIYGELRFAPLVHTAEGLTPEEVVRTVADETSTQIAMTGIEASVILCTLRDFSGAKSLQTAELVRQFAPTTPVAALDIAGDEIAHPLERHLRAFHLARAAGLGITVHAGEAGGPESVREALDIAGDEIAHPLERHLRAFHLARAAGLGITVHAGEAGGPESVREALDHTGTQRIGHGVRSIEDSTLVDRLVREGIHLEICPICNVQTHAVATIEDHPVDRLYRRGVSLGISTDTRGVTATSLTEEYEVLQREFGWTLEDFGRVNRYALAAAFVDDEVREGLAGLLDEAYPAEGTRQDVHRTDT